MPCGQMMVFACILCKNFSQSKALWMAWQQVAAFQLTLAQHKTAGWWVPLPAISRLWLQQYMPSPAFSNFRIMRQQRTLALARVLQAHTEESGCPTGVLCEVARELQWCMTPLLAFNGDEIVEASLLQSMEGECRTSPIPEEQAVLLGDNQTWYPIWHQTWHWNAPSSQAAGDLQAGTAWRVNHCSYCLPHLLPLSKAPFLPQR